MAAVVGVIVDMVGSVVMILVVWMVIVVWPWWIVLHGDWHCCLVMDQVTVVQSLWLVVGDGIWVVAQACFA
jgi:hypothetical protein